MSWAGPTTIAAEALLVGGIVIGSLEALPTRACCNCEMATWTLAGVDCADGTDGGFDTTDFPWVVCGRLTEGEGEGAGVEVVGTGVACVCGSCLATFICCCCFSAAWR